jgi:hypothetical protein
MARLLPKPVIQEIYKAALAARLNRDALIAGLPDTFTAGLVRVDQGGAQIVTDLLRLNQVLRLDDGTVPLREWLETAEMLAGPIPEAAVFRDALRQLDEASAEPRPPAPAAPPIKLTSTDSQTREQALGRIFLDMFSADEVRRFIRYLPHGNEMDAALPGASSAPATLVAEVVTTAIRMGIVDSAFFDALVAERPRRKDEIERVRRMFLG